MKEILLTEDLLHPFGTTLTVLVDKIKAKCVMGTFGGYSERINITLEEEHPLIGKEFSTKYFQFKEPGLIEWGHEKQTLKVIVLDEESSFDQNANNHPFN